MDLKSSIRTIPNWPKQGVMFRDITTLLKDAKAFNYIIDKLCERYKNDHIDLVAGIESRGFILAGAIAHELHKGFIPIRKEGTLMASINLIEKLGGHVVECAVIIELPDLHGREKIEAKGCKLFSLVQFEGE